MITAAFFCYVQNRLSLPCTKQKAPDYSDVKRSLQNCGAIVRNLLRVVCLAPRIWRWLLSFCRICGPLAVLIRRGDLRWLLGEVLAGAQLTHATSCPNPRPSPSDNSYYVSSCKRRNVCFVASYGCDRNAFSPLWFTWYEGIIKICSPRKTRMVAAQQARTCDWQRFVVCCLFDSLCSLLGWNNQQVLHLIMSVIVSHTFFAQSIIGNWLHINMFVRNYGKNFHKIWYWGCILKVPVENFVACQLWPLRCCI